VHLLGCANDGVDRTGLDAQGTAYAVFFIDQRCGARTLVPVDGVEWNDGFAEQVGQTCDALLAAGRALVMTGCVGSHGLGIGTTRRVAALGALRLRKQVFQFVGESRGNAQGKKRSIAETNIIRRFLELHKWKSRWTCSSGFVGVAY
jgi:hypothetical protein